ncbi:unnamed protein product [Albugo candida]|uniref:Uncharacterized protein n=1 Tax=Albugo candida TaxID=65357 RepID=A0A024GR82_9STRA|nr:unnamed protein product [Albugo candida]|eukprot:CCI49058.1 unnamed protein product [Albugo candida]
MGMDTKIICLKSFSRVHRRLWRLMKTHISHFVLNDSPPALYPLASSYVERNRSFVGTASSHSLKACLLASNNWLLNEVRQMDGLIEKDGMQMLDISNSWLLSTGLVSSPELQYA